MKRNFLQLTALIISLTNVFQFSGCALSRQLSKLEENRRLWQEMKIADYSYAGSSICGDVIIEVQDNKTISIRQAFKSQVGIRLDCYRKFDTIDKIFDYVRQELESGKPVYVKYNEKFSYPEEIRIGSSFHAENRNNMEFVNFETSK